MNTDATLRTSYPSKGPNGGGAVLAEGLTRKFGDLIAVDRIDISIAPGEIFGFLGPNGAGKTTAIRMLTTLLKPTAGSAWVAGFDIVRQAGEVRRSIGVALQDAAIDPLMTGRELLSLQAVLHGLGKKEGKNRAAHLLEVVGLTAAADRRVGTYSGGMRRRLDLALALMHDPKVLFLDEPTTGLDPNSRVTLWEELRKLNREFGTTIFLTTQYMEEADRLSSRIAIIDLGRIVAEGTPAKLRAEVGDPTLRIALSADVEPKTALEVLEKFGEAVPASGSTVAIRLAGGAERVASVARALDAAQVKVEGLELHSPTLDDVFVMVTGKRLEGATIPEAQPR